MRHIAERTEWDGRLRLCRRHVTGGSQKKAGNKHTMAILVLYTDEDAVRNQLYVVGARPTAHALTQAPQVRRGEALRGARTKVVWL